LPKSLFAVLSAYIKNRAERSPLFVGLVRFLGSKCARFVSIGRLDGGESG